MHMHITRIHAQTYTHTCTCTPIHRHKISATTPQCVKQYPLRLPRAQTAVVISGGAWQLRTPLCRATQVTNRECEERVTDRDLGLCEEGFGRTPLLFRGKFCMSAKTPGCACTARPHNPYELPSEISDA